MPYIGGQSPGVRISPGQATIAVHVLVLSIADSGICPARKSSCEGGKEARIVYSRRAPRHQQRGKTSSIGSKSRAVQFLVLRVRAVRAVLATRSTVGPREFRLNGAAAFAGVPPFSFTWELDWRLRQEPVRDENRYRPFLSPAIDVEPQHSGDNGAFCRALSFIECQASRPLSPPNTRGMAQPFDQMSECASRMAKQLGTIENFANASATA